MPGRAERLANVHPNALKQVSSNPVYVSAKRKEYKITEAERGLWKIYSYNGGVLPNVLKGRYTSFKEAERALIAWLKLTDKFGNRAVYPEYGES